MRYVVGILLLASPALSSEPVYSWRSRADEPERVYLYLDGKQIGGWCYSAKHYRPFDGTSWGPPTNAAPVRPPERVVVRAPQKPLVIVQPSSPPPQLRGPLRVKAGTIMGQVVTDMTIQMFTDAIPRAIADAFANGQYQSSFRFSVTRSPQPSEGQTAPPGPSQPASSPQRRWVIPRR